MLRKVTQRGDGADSECPEVDAPSLCMTEHFRRCAGNDDCRLLYIVQDPVDVPARHPQSGAQGKVMVKLGVNLPEALARMRAHAWAAGRVFFDSF